MTEIQAVEYINNYTWSTTRLGLSRTRELLASLGDPQKRLKFIHVAGSNGKGSTCAMLASVLRAAGYRTGLYISPHLQSFCERIQVNGRCISGEELGAVTERIKAAADAMDDHPSQFELSTAIALTYFADTGCDIVVLETGLGGELDSTNVIDAPEIAVITNIGHEHTEYLGNTLEEIASAKTGIIKTGCDVVCYDVAPEAARVIKAVCEQRGAPLSIADFSAITPLAHDLAGQDFLWQGQKLHLPLLGAHQLNNAAVALTALSALRSRGWAVGDDAVREGLALVKWPARFEVLGRSPLFILDGAHNPQCAEALAGNIAEYLPNREITFLMGVLRDKDCEAMLDAVAPLAKSFACVTPNSPRALGGEELARRIEVRGIEARAFDDIEDAVCASLQTGLPTAAFGSLYMAGEIREIFMRLQKNDQRRSCIDARRALSAEQRAQYSRMICQRLTALPALGDARLIFSYMATYDEANLGEFNEWARANGKSLAFPISKKDGVMLAAVPESDGSWRTGSLGIIEPEESTATVVSPRDIDAVIAPCVAFDKDKNRLGHGAGYYDRYLALCPDAPVIAAAFEAQRVDEVADVRQWDIPMDNIVTERGVY